MAIGDGTDATDAGMDVVLSTQAANLLAQFITETRDYLANGPTYWKNGVAAVPVSAGGTGATTASAARTALGLADTVSKVAGATTTPTGNALVQYGSTGRINCDTPVSSGNAATKGYVDSAVAGIPSPDLSSRVAKSGDAMSGDLFLPNSSTATFSWTVGYINGDGRVCRGASSERFKKYVTQRNPLELGNVFPDLYRFQMKHGDGSWRYGWIAERLAEDPDLQPFVVYDKDGLPESIDFISLLQVQNAVQQKEIESLKADRDAQSAAVAALLARVEALEAA